MSTKRKSIFVTATGTDVGKTYVSALLVKRLRELGVNCGYYKPALSGAIKQNDGTLLAGDCDFVARISNLGVKPNECLSYCFEEAVSPHLASKRAGVKIDKNKIKSDYENLSAQYECLVVEGAGGITCPFDLDNDKLLLTDVIKFLNLETFVVADGGLGTINSVLLTVEYAKQHNIIVKGIIFNNFDKNDFMHADNKIQVEKLTGIKVIATVEKNGKDLEIADEELLNLF